MTFGILLLLASALAQAQFYSVNFDSKTFFLVLEQTAKQLTAEKVQNNLVDSIKSNKLRVAANTEAIAGYRYSQHESMKNINGLGREAKIYELIGSKALNIVNNIPKTYNAFATAEIGNKNDIMRELMYISTRTYGLVNTYVNLCGNGKIGNPMQNASAAASGDGGSLTVTGVDAGASSITNAGDSENLLSREQRIEMAYSLYRQLNKIDYRVSQLLNYAYHGINMKNGIRIAEDVAGEIKQANAKKTIERWKSNAKK